MEFLEDFLRQYMPRQEIEWYLGFGFLGTLVSTALGIFVFEVKKRPRWIGALIGFGIAAASLVVSLFARQSLDVEGLFELSSPIYLLLMISCIVISLPLYLAIWLLVAEGKRKNSEKPFMQAQPINNYTPLGAGGGMPAPSPSMSSTNEMHSVYHQAPRPVSEPIRPQGLVKGGSTPTKNSIFISYRRDDSSELVGRIYDHLVAKFGKEAIFRDVEAIPLGVDFRQYLRTVVGNCGILIAVIGDRWLDMRDEHGNLRLADPNDFVRIEIASALQRTVPVVPVLIRNAQMPKESDLPEDLAELAFRNGTKVRTDPDFGPDMERLMQAIHLHLDKEA